MTRAAVYDDGGLNSPRVAEDLPCEDGRGLLIVNALSVRMGVGGNAQGRVVWADILFTGQDIPNQLEFPELKGASSPQELARSLSRLSAYVEPACRT